MLMARTAGLQQRCEDQNPRGIASTAPSHIMGVMITAWPSELFRR
jgi:hypothetical protein